MKKFKLLSLLLLILALQFSNVYAARADLPISAVTITGIDYPYSTGSQLDTSANLSDSSKSTIYKLYWSQTSENLNKVTIVLRPDYDYYYTESTSATINGNQADSIFINEDNCLEISYTFPQNDSASNPNSSSSLKHVITVLYTKNGTISPNPIRAPHNKNFKVQIIPDEGYQVKDVLIDGESVGAVEEYTFRRVTESHKIKAYFEPIEGYVPEEDKDDEVISDDQNNEMVSGDGNVSIDVNASGDNESGEIENLFKDVSEKDWYYNSVNFVTSRGVFNGTSEYEFSPNNKMTRGMLVKVLYNIELNQNNISKENVATNLFDDVEADAWYTEAISWAASNGIVNGVGNNLFAPNKEVTREQVATILYNYAKYIEIEISDFSEVNMADWSDLSQISEYATEALKWTTANEIIKGKTTTTLEPKATATRAEVAEMMMRFLNKI